MATKHFCDACDRETVELSRVKTSFTPFSDDTHLTQREFDLCDTCRKKFIRELPPDYRPKTMPGKGDFG